MRQGARFLLDTHVLIWLESDLSRISLAVLAQLRDPDNLIYASNVSLWEMVIKQSAGKLSAVMDVARALRRMQMLDLPIRLAHIEQVRLLPLHHRDPFDRILVAQAQAERLTLVTADRRLDVYDVSILRA